MAQKRMFDKGIIETDSFMDMPMPTKALYFLLGMEADDEGFVSPARVIRIYGGNLDDLKVLIAKEFVIQFESGVIVITDWHENNWLDNRRVKKTVYQTEKKLLNLSKRKYKLLSNGLANAKRGEYRIEQDRTEQKRIEEDSISADAENSDKKKEKKSSSVSKEKTKIKKPAEPTVESQVIEQIDRDVQKLMCFFHDNGNPMINFGHMGQRNACKDMIKKLGYEEVEKWANFALKVSKIPFSPVITTPIALKNKWADLEAYRDRYLKEREEKGVHVIKNNQ